MGPDDIYEWFITDAYPHHLYCSKCYKTILPNIEILEQLSISLNYCPNCGAKMLIPARVKNMLLCEE